MQDVLSEGLWSASVERERGDERRRMLIELVVSAGRGNICTIVMLSVSGCEYSSVFCLTMKSRRESLRETPTQSLNTFDDIIISLP